MKASVIIPFYNSQNYIKEAVTSILEQSHKDFELLLINDFSTDGSPEIVKNISDSRIKVINLDKNIGDAFAMNHGIKIAKGEYVFRMDSDDISVFDRLEKQINFLDKNPACVVLGGSAEKFGKTSGIYSFKTDPAEIKVRLLFYNCINHPTVAMRKNFLIENEFFYTKEFPHAEDYDLWTRIIQKAEICNLPDIILKYRTHEKQIGSKFRIGQNESAYKISQKQFKNILGKLDSAELEATESLFDFRFKIKDHRHNIEKIQKLLKRVLLENEKKQIYNQNILSKYIADVLLRL